ncbi:murein biosynthesis integral membrane protein MurJ [Candidatus Berkelbacteria bacterium]|nr:murein biosynthesis integral membrane protein MurJ [Candidatus Berkelbacteria bacterium]
MTSLKTVLHQQNSVKGATLLLAITLTVSNILGLVRDRLLAAKIPADDLDTYFAAFRLPDLLTNLIVVGDIAVIFLPIFTDLKTRDASAAWRAANAIITIIVTLLAVASLFVVVAMPFLMPLVVPEFPPDKLADTIRFAQWLSITPILFGLSYFISGIVNSFHRFVVYSLAPLVYNLSIIVATALFGERFGVAGVIGGVLIGAFLHMLVQLPVARRLGWHWQPRFDFHDPAVRRTGQLMVPRMIGLLAMQLASLVTTAVASGWAGAIAFFNLATNIQTMPIVIGANSLASALFPTLSTAVAEERHEVFQQHLMNGIRWILFLLIPASVGLILLRAQLVRLILGAGQFGWEATQTTADVLGWLALSLPAAGLITLLARGFYARQDMKTPMVIAVVASLVTIAASLWLPAVLPITVNLDPSRPDYILHVGEVAALAIAVSLGTLVQAGLLLFASEAQLGISLSRLMQPLGKIVGATVVMGLAVQAVKAAVGTQVSLDTGLNLLIQTTVAIAAGGVSYVLMASLLRCEEWHELRQLLKQKLSMRMRTLPD